MIVHTDCRFFRGEVPCRPHKSEGMHCEVCDSYDPVSMKILIIKLGAAGDVIRTTPLLRRLKTEYPGAEIHWLTQFPEILPSGWIDHIYGLNSGHLEILKQIDFDVLYNLDKDREACALCNSLDAHEKFGFFMEGGKCHPINAAAEYKWLTGLFDDLNQNNVKNYPQEIFEICGFEFQGEEYIIDAPGKNSWDFPKDMPIVGLNTGCGTRWKSRLWPEAHWAALTGILMKNHYKVLFLGGKDEHEKNQRLAQKTGGLYAGHFSIPDFIDLVNECEVVVTAVTMTLHIALGLKKQVVLFNNIFNRHEFEMYNRGVIIEPPKDCLGCFMGDCEESCMELIAPEQVAEVIRQFKNR